MAYVFISYSHKDEEYFHKLENELIRWKIGVWSDKHIDSGDEWAKVIQKKLDECGAFIVIMSEDAFESKWVQNEIARAGRKKKPFFPLLLQGDNWLSFEATQYMDVKSGALPPNSYFEKIEELLGMQVHQIAPPEDMVEKLSQPSNTQELNELRDWIVSHILTKVMNGSGGDWEIGIFRITYSVPWKNPPKGFEAPLNYSLGSKIINPDLLRRFDPKTYLENKEDFDKLTFTPIHGYNIKMARTIAAEYNFIKRLNLELGMVSQTGFTKTDIESFAEKLIDIHTTHHIPLSEIKIKVA